LRLRFKALLETRRTTILYAAAADFPYHDPLNRTARDAFDLPANGPYRDTRK